MKLYNIYWYNRNLGYKHIATTNNLNLWLKSNNKERAKKGKEKESLKNFLIKAETKAYIF